MLSECLFSTNSFDKTALDKAREYGYGLEVEEFLWRYSEEEISAKHALVRQMMAGFSRFSFHGTAIDRDIAEISRLSDIEMLARYNESYQQACLQGISRIVFHANFFAGLHSREAWMRDSIAFWKNFLDDKPSTLRVYLENFIDETPHMLAELHDAVDDARFKICLDTGHACCNSTVPINEWIAQLGKRIAHVHLHNNDGVSDKHWPLGKGVLDIAEVIERLLAHASVETFVLECDLEDSVKWLRQHLRHPIA